MLKQEAVLTHTQRLRELLFNKTSITGLFCFENSKNILEGLDRRFKFDVLTFRKGDSTEVFPAAFVRQDVEELEDFPNEGTLHITVDFIRRFSPDLLIIMEFRSQRDVRVCEKMLLFPLLGEKLTENWNVKFASGMITNHLAEGNVAKIEPDSFPLYEGKMLHQFMYTSEPPGFWIDKQSNTRFLQQLEMPQRAGYRGYRLGVRNVTARTHERTIIATILPPNVVLNNTINVIASPLDADVLLFLTAVFNSFVVDFYMRLRVHTRIGIHDLYQLPVPRLTRPDKGFLMIARRAARLICTTMDFKELWEAAMSEPWLPELAVISHVERNRLRAELDGLIAHLYSVREEEFTSILRQFPLISDPITIAAQNAYRDVERGLLV